MSGCISDSDCSERGCIGSLVKYPEYKGSIRIPAGLALNVHGHRHAVPLKQLEAVP
jgi:hypothetical protein